MLHYRLFTWKGNCYDSFTVFSVVVPMIIHNKVSSNIVCLKNFLSFSSIPFTISGAQLKEQVIKKNSSFDIGNYLNT